MDQPQTQLFPASVPCAFCQQNAVVAHTLRRGKIHVFVYECDCGACTVICNGPSVGMAQMQAPGATQTMPALVVSPNLEKLALPGSYLREIKNGGKS